MYSFINMITRGSSWIPSWVLIVASSMSLIVAHTILEEYTCKQSDIEYGKTLRGGQLAGVFRDQGYVKNMQECIHKCCLNKQCNVAMVTGKKCFGVRCHNDTSCETVPGDEGDLDMQIAKVGPAGPNDFVEKQNNDSRRFDPDAKCPHNEVLYNVKLKAGLHAGKFTDIGKVKSIMTCVRYCCDSKAKSNVDCDLAFMLKDRCYLVKCFSEDRCQALPARGVDFSFNQKMAFVAPWLFEKNKKIVEVPSGKSPHHLQCIQSKLYTDSQLLDGPAAGHYTDIGPVSNVHTCTRLCCEDAKCDVAYMFGKNCFLVKCYSEKACRVVKTPGLKDKPSKKNHQKTVQYIVKRTFGVAVRDDGKHVKMIKPGENICRLDGKIHRKTTLRAGMLSGKLTPHKKVKGMKSCVKKCCSQKNCHVALMTSGKCYSVYCTNPDYCSPKDAPKEMLHDNPMVAFVRRGDVSFAPGSKSSVKTKVPTAVRNPFASLASLPFFPKLQIPMEKSSYPGDPMKPAYPVSPDNPVFHSYPEDAASNNEGLNLDDPVELVLNPGDILNSATRGAKPAKPVNPVSQNNQNVPQV